MSRTRLFLIVLLLFIGVSLAWFRWGGTFPEWLSVCATAWMFLIGPVLLFVTARMAREEIHFENPSGISGAVLRVLVISPLSCFGLVCVFAGVAVIALAVWTAVVKADYDMLKNVPGLAVFAAITVFGAVVLRRAFVGEGLTRREIEKAARDHEAALLDPDWSFYAGHLGRPAPEALKQLYRDPQKLLGVAEWRGSDRVWEFQSFEPLRRDCLVPADESDLPCDIVPFAIVDDESWVFLKPGSGETDLVLMADPAKPGQILLLADSVEGFLAGLVWGGAAADA